MDRNASLECNPSGDCECTADQYLAGYGTTGSVQDPLWKVGWKIQQLGQSKGKSRMETEMVKYDYGRKIEVSRRMEEKMRPERRTETRCTEA